MVKNPQASRRSATTVGAVGERRTGWAIAVGIGVTILLFLGFGSIALASAGGIASGVACGRHSRRTAGQALTPRAWRALRTVVNDRGASLLWP